MLAPSRPSEGAPCGVRRPDLVDWTYRTATDKWSPLPKWAGFFRELGSAVAGVDEDATRVVIAVTTPTRAFAAALCAAGVVIERVKNQVSADPAAHFAYLRTLALGTAVTYRPGSTGSKKGRGILHDFSAKDGEDYVLIRDPLSNESALSRSVAQECRLNSTNPSEENPTWWIPKANPPAPANKSMEVDWLAD